MADGLSYLFICLFVYLFIYLFMYVCMYVCGSLRLNCSTAMTTCQFLSNDTQKLLAPYSSFHTPVLVICTPAFFILYY